MCDTFVALSPATKHKKTILAKNSDRPPNEAQHLVRIPARIHKSGEQVQCTYIQIPQVNETLGILLSKPFWMWGAEMGVNEAGLAIGNEAIYSKVPANKEPALLGMDLLRLALERAENAKKAVELIIDLLENYGQGGNCSIQGDMYYHNSFLIADPQDAWVLETIGRDWVAKKVEDIYSISNILTISEKWDMASSRITPYLEESGTRIDLAKDYSDFLYTTFSNARNRCSSTRMKLTSHRGRIDVGTMLDILRQKNDHQDPASGLTNVDVCRHYGFGPIQISQTTGSMVAVLDKDHPLVFATGTAAPCTGIFKPLWVDSSLPEMGPTPTDIFDPSTLFWSHEVLHRIVERQFPKRIELYAKDRNRLEKDFINGALDLINAPREDRMNFSMQCFEHAARAEEDWVRKVQSIPEEKTLTHRLHDFAWNKIDTKANIKFD